MKLSVLFYLLPLLYAFFTPDNRDYSHTNADTRAQDQDQAHTPAQEHSSIPSQNLFRAQNLFHGQPAHQIQNQAQDLAQHQADTESLAAQETTEAQDDTPLIKRSTPGAFPRVSRSRNLSELCLSPKKAIPCIMALHRTRSAGANQQSISKKEIVNLPNLGIPSSPMSASLPSPLSLGHVVTTQFDFTRK